MADTLALDYRTAFDLAPVGMVLSRHRLMVDCNQQLLAMFGAEREQLIGQSFEVLYPTHDEFERTGGGGVPICRLMEVCADAGRLIIAPAAARAARPPVIQFVLLPM